ncbi:MAG: Archaeal YidC/Oxa1-related membrane protein [Candidatus Alkanophagales archaeon MCA70_species_2]|nr:Archaeal YidC/Oxa1-related membrane protein [Candidatus Alkanophaga liquidiphilum]
MQASKNAIKESVERFFLVLGFSLLFGIMIFPELRNGMGVALDAVFSPLVPLFGCNVLLVIFVLALLTGVYSALIQHYTIDWTLMEKAKEFQKRLRELQKEYLEAKRENNKFKMKKIEKERLELMKEQTQFSGEMLRQQMKPMAYISIITIPLFMWLYYFVSQNGEIMQAVFPLVGETDLTDWWFIFPYWVLWYIICSIPIGQLVRKFLELRR